MRLTLILLILFPAEYATWYSDQMPFKCGGNVKIPSIFVCDGKRQCPNDTAQSFHADDEDYEMCVATRYLPPEELVLTAQSEDNLTVLISWSFEDSATRNPEVELTSGSDDSENVLLAGYLFSGTSDHHNFKKSFTAQVNEFHVSGLKPWTLYEIVLRPYYTFDGSLQPIFKVGKAAYAIYRSEATAPAAPTYAEVLSVEEKKISVKVGDPLRWNGEPGGYWVRWETLDSLPEHRGQAYFGIPETRPLEIVHMTISVDLVPGRQYGFHTSALNFGHHNKSFVGPEVSTSAVVPCTDPVSLTAIATGPHDVTVTWRSESFAEYFEVSALDLDASQTDKKEKSVPDDDEAVQSNNTFLSPQDVLINVTAKHDAASVYNITLHKLISYSNVSVRVKSCGMEKCTPGIVAPIFTQSDCSPFFEVLYVNMTAFEVRLTPRRYTQYQVRYCHKDNVCKTIFTPGSVSIVDLMADTTYTVDVREGLIDANRRVILGPAARRRVSTGRDVSTRYLPPNELVLTTQSENNLTVLISWSFEDSAITKSEVELTSDSDDSEAVHFAGYLFSGTSDHHTFRKTFTAQVNEYRVSGLKPWTLYEIVLQPYYTFNGSLQPIYKVGKAAYAIYHSEATPPTAPAYAEVLSVEDKKVSMKVGDPLRWNGEPGGYLVRWETLDSLPEHRGQAYFGIPKTRSFENEQMTISVDLVPGRHYRLHTSGLNFGHQNISFVGPEVSTSAVVPCTDPVSLTAIATGPHDVTVTWRSESFVEYFEVSALYLNASPTDKKEQSVPDDDEAVPSNNTLLSPQDVFINLTAKEDAASVYNITFYDLISYSNVSVRVKSCGMEKCTPGISTPIFTLSDNPSFFKVLNVNRTAFEVRITPSRYTQYQVRYCNRDNACKTIFTPESVSIVDLKPGMTYTVDVREGLIDANRRVILGPAARTRVSTKRDDSCVYNVTAPRGQISSPNYPNIYPNGASCSWLIKTNQDMVIRLAFNDFELEKNNKCITDYVSVYDGSDTNAPILGTYCGNTAPLPIFSSSNHIYMVFKSDRDVQGKGFSATHTELYTALMAGQGSEQRIYSHAQYGNQHYEDNIDRDWVIRAPAGHVRLWFSAFDVEVLYNSCHFDFVKVFDGVDESAPLLKTFCGNEIPGEIISSSDALLLRFHTDVSGAGSGFVVLYAAVE